MKKKLSFLLLLFCFSLDFISPSILLDSPNDLSIPSSKYFKRNKEIIGVFKYKKITIAEYLTDPLIMYASLWGCFGLTIPLWERNEGISKNDENYWESDNHRGFDKLVTNNSAFGDRLKMEPFASGRIDPITKRWNDMTVFRNDIYAKNIIEPVFFVYLGLYLRAKNYHPAIMITEIILLSLLYEFTIRPFYLMSSFEQFLKNPAIGIVFGILLDELSTFLLSTPYKGLHVLAYLFNPFNALPNSRIHPMLFFDPYRKTANIEAIIKL